MFFDLMPLSPERQEELLGLFDRDIKTGRRDIGCKCPLMKDFSVSVGKERRDHVEACDCPTARKVLLPTRLCGEFIGGCPVRKSMIPTK